MLRGTHPNITADVQSQPFREKISVCLVSRGPIDEPAESYGGQGADGNASEHQSDAAI